MATKRIPNQYRLAIVKNKLGITHLRFYPPRGGEIIMSGELLSSLSGARRTADNIQKGVASRGIRIVEMFEGTAEEIAADIETRQT